MAYINTNDPYIQEYCKGHPEADAALKSLLELRENFLCRYGNPAQGRIAEESGWAKEFRRTKEVQLGLLKELKRVCDENGLRLFLVYGSLLGAVRSGGMLDGDDDIDVALMREDYDKLAALSGTFSPPYFLQDNYNDSCFYGGYMKLRDTRTSAIEPQNWYTGCCEGIFLDIFPIDKSFASRRKEKGKLRKIRRLQRLLYAKSYGFFASFKDMPLLVWKSYKYLGKLFPRGRLLRNLDEAFREGDTSSGKLGIYTHYTSVGGAKYIPATAYAKTCTMTYEGMSFLAPAGWDDALRCFYGPGYLAPSRSREGLHAFYSADVPYGTYKARFTRLFAAAPDKSRILVLVGDKELFAEYKKRFPGPEYTPAASFAPGEEGDLRSFRPADTHVVIAAFDFPPVEEAVRGMGFFDYSIYVYDRSWLLLPELKSSRMLYLLAGSDISHSVREETGR